MAARSKRPTRVTADGLNQYDAFATHRRASQHREELLQEAVTLRRAGKIGEAKGVEKRAQQVEQLVGAFEADERALSGAPE
jgi:hypothetical protein